MSVSFSRPWTALLLGLLAQLPVPAGPAETPTVEGPTSFVLPLPLLAKHLAGFGFPVATGAAPGYVDERSCALCHPKLSESYREKGMARAFQAPKRENDIEDFKTSPFFHAASNQSFQMIRRDGRLVFRRWQTDDKGEPINVFEQPVDWILGSGDHARTYLYRTGAGDLYQLPLAWYSQPRSWGMAPGFDRPDHDGVIRRVRRECVFCHVSYPDLPAGADAYGAPQAFPARLPEGIGCQRCHGPAAEHVWLALGGVGTREEIRDSVFNPGNLPAGRRDEVCMGCHLQPSVALPGLRRFGRSDFSFRPGEPLADYFVQVDVEEEGRAAADRFEINHHPYRLRQSRCYLASGGALTCLTCHDPHRRLADDERAAHFRAVCLTCHREETLPAGAHAAKPSDCVFCHMPKRRTQDVVHVVMTDHRIQKAPAGPELLAPLSETEPGLIGIHLLDSGTARDPMGEVYRADAVVRAAGTADAVSYLAKRLEATRPVAVEPWLDLTQAMLRLRRYADAERAAAAVLERRPDDLQAAEWLALARAGQGKVDEAIHRLQQLVGSAPDRAEAEYNLGRLLALRNQPQEAERHLVRAVATRPNMSLAWHHLGEVRAVLGRTDDARACWRRALTIDPTLTASYVSLGKALLRKGDRNEALRWLRHGALAAAQPEEVKAALNGAS